MWSLEIPTTDQKYLTLRAAFLGVIQDHIPRASYRRLSGTWEDSFDATWVDKLPSKLVSKLETQIINVLGRTRGSF